MLRRGLSPPHLFFLTYSTSLIKHSWKSDGIRSLCIQYFIAMDSRIHRSQSLPPSYNLTGTKSRIAKPPPRNAGTQYRSSRHRSLRSWEDIVDSISEQTEPRSATPDSVCASNSVDTLSNSKASNGLIPNADPRSSFIKSLQCLQKALTQFLSDVDADQDEKSVSEAIGASARVGEDRVLHPTATFLQCRCSPRHKCVSTTREQQAIRKRVLERAAKEHSTGKTWTTEHVLAAYGSHEIKLDGQEAVTADIGRDSWCTECQKRCTQCIWVERDRFWNRNQCVGCVRRKVSCSLDKFGQDSLQGPSQ